MIMNVKAFMIDHKYSSCNPRSLLITLSLVAWSPPRSGSASLSIDCDKRRVSWPLRLRGEAGL